MGEIIAYCGLSCHTCPIYVAARTSDPEEQIRLRTEVASILAKHYGMQCGPREITDCDGCPTAAGRLFFTCQRCLIRDCARSRGLSNCAGCNDYACVQLQSFFVAEPSAKTRLDALRRATTEIADTPASRS